MKKILITMLIFLMIIPAVSAENDLNSIIEGSNNNDVIILENDTFVSSSMIIDKNLTITSNENSVINGNSNQLFTVTKGNSLTLQGLTIINAYEEYGGAIYNEGTLTIVNSSLNNNRALYYGGSIYNDGDLTIINSTISNNTAANQGGAIHNNLGKITIINSTLNSNKADRGGAIYNNHGILNISGSHFDSNVATNRELGGAIKNWGPLNVYNTTFTRNNGGVEGGAIYSIEYPSLINSSIFINNTGNIGSAIINIKAESTIINSYFENNDIFNDNGKVNEINNTIKNTKPPKKENSTIKPSIQNTTMSVNNTTDNQNESIQNTTAENNTIPISNQNETENIQNTTIPENTSANNQNENMTIPENDAEYVDNQNETLKEKTNDEADEKVVENTALKNDKHANNEGYNQINSLEKVAGNPLILLFLTILFIACKKRRL